MKTGKLLLTLMLSFLGIIQSIAQVPAFPGADGYGRYTRGGRGGAVYYVTTLEDNDSPGSLRYGVTRLSDVTILFKVSGTIHLNSSLTFSQSNMTVAGQSAPGDGICLADYPVFVSGSNVIVRYMRFRMGDEKLTADEADGADAFGGRFCHNVIIDHCSISWSTDECASFYANYDFTMQWCIISESMRMSLHSKGAHGYGAIWGGIGASYYHNLMLHHDSRTPRFGTGNLGNPNDHLTDMRNNVIYNWSGNGCYGAEGMYVNIINNYYKPGAASTSQAKNRFISIDDATSSDGTTSIWGKFYITGNYNSKYTTINNDNWNGVAINTSALMNGNATKSTVKSDVELGEVPLLHQHTAWQCLAPVLAYAGCSFKRDDIDKRLASECENGTYTYMGSSANKGGIIDHLNDLKPTNATNDWSPWPTLNSTTPPEDSDGDGMPNEWETANGLDHTDATDGKKVNNEGYTMLEVYLNSIVADITEAQYKDATEVGKAGEPYSPESWSTDIFVSWSMASGNISEKAETTNADYVSSGDYAIGSELSLYGKRTINDTVYTQFQPTVENKSASAACTITYHLYLPDGVTFRPTDISFASRRFGTSGGYIDAEWVDSYGNKTTLETGIHPVDYKGTENPNHQIDMSGNTTIASSGKCQLVLYVYKLASTKQIGLANLKIGGHVTVAAGISSTSFVETTTTKTYDTAGRLIPSSHQGIYIIRQQEIDRRTTTKKRIRQ